MRSEKLEARPLATSSFSLLASGFGLMHSTLAQIAVAAAILGGAYVITHLFARAMYITCAQCRTLNARRRRQCRNCGHELPRR